MADLDRDVAGVRCREVLADLSSYLDGDLLPERVRQLEAHVQGCDWCERFGGRFSGVVRAFREGLGSPAPVPEGMQARLRARLRGEMR
jgi:anti-sigma factor RsiW